MKKIRTYSDLYIQFPARIINVQSISIMEEVNEHAVCKINMKIFEKDEYKFIYKISPKIDIKVYLKNEAQTEIIFIGIMTFIEVKRIDSQYFVYIELISKTFLLDCEKKSRSFQNKDNLYSNLFKKIVTDDNSGIVYFNYLEDCIQNEPIIQYRETDWEFLKRLASKINSKIIVNARSPEPTIWIGKQEGFYHEQLSHEFEFNKKTNEFLKAQKNYGDWEYADKTSFKIKSVHSYFISDNILYNSGVFKVYAKETSLVNGFIVYTYSLLQNNVFKKELIVNSNILGVSIDGKVIDVSGDKVKVHLCIDAFQSDADAYWYSCETSYTSEGQTGFYFMPQKGDTIKLYTPTEYGEKAYIRAINCFDGEKNIKIQNPDIKYIGSTYGKEIMFTPYEMQITGKNGIVTINMNDEDGIALTSGININISTQVNGIIKGKEIVFRAGNDIVLATSGSCIAVNAEVHIKANNGVSK